MQLKKAELVSGSPAQTVPSPENILKYHREVTEKEKVFLVFLLRIFRGETIVVTQSESYLQSHRAVVVVEEWE